MFCPNCKAEYREGIRECSDCQVPLVGKLAPELEQKIERVELVTVLATPDHGAIAVAKSILNDAGIKYFTKNEAFATFGYSSLAVTVEIQVADPDAEEAKKLLEGL